MRASIAELERRADELDRRTADIEKSAMAALALPTGIVGSYYLFRKKYYTVKLRAVLFLHCICLSLVILFVIYFFLSLLSFLFAIRLCRYRLKKTNMPRRDKKYITYLMTHLAALEQEIKKLRSRGHLIFSHTQLYSCITQWRN